MDDPDAYFTRTKWTANRHYPIAESASRRYACAESAERHYSFKE